MHTGPSRDKRMPRWMMIVLAAFSVLFVLGAVFGKTPQPQQEQPVAAKSSAPSTSTTPPPTTSSSAAPSAYRVAGIVDAGTVKVTGPDGERIVKILGLTTPPNTNGCFAEETLTWAKNTLAGQEVIIRAVSDEAGVALASVSLVSGGDYATAALKAGYAKFASRAVETTIGTALKAAEDTARAAGNGLWGPPCFGKIDTPPTSVAPPPQPVAPPITRAEPTTKKSTPPPAAAEPDPPKAVSYANCDAVRAAGAAPLYAGQPGYSRKLDRDGDGVACEPKK